MERNAQPETKADLDRATDSETGDRIVADAANFVDLDAVVVLTVRDDVIHYRPMPSWI